MHSGTATATHPPPNESFLGLTSTKTSRRFTKGKSKTHPLIRRLCSCNVRRLCERALHYTGAYTRTQLQNWGKQPLARPLSHARTYTHSASDEDSCVERIFTISTKHLPNRTFSTFFLAFGQNTQKKREREPRTRRNAISATNKCTHDTLYPPISNAIFYFRF